MAIQFGLSRLRGYRNGYETGVACTTGAANTGIAVATGSVWLDGVNCALTAVTITIGAGHTGSACWAIAVLPAGNSSTAAATAVSVDPTGTVHAILDRFTFGTGANTLLLLADKSGTTALQTFARAQNVTLNITYDQAVARGGTLIFANDAKFFNGNIEGTVEYADVDVQSWSRLMGGSYASGGASSGTWNLSATNKPFPFMIETQEVTDGVTATIRVLKCYSTQLGIKADTENYTIPSMNFVAVGNKLGDVLQITQ